MSSIPVDPTYLAQLRQATPRRQADTPAVVKAATGYQAGDKFIRTGEEFLLMSAAEASQIPNAVVLTSPATFVEAPTPITPSRPRDVLKLIKVSTSDEQRVVQPKTQKLRLTKGTIHELRGFGGRALRMYRFGNKSCNFDEEALGTAGFSALKRLLDAPAKANLVELQYLKVDPGLVKSPLFRLLAPKLNDNKVRLSYHLDAAQELELQAKKKRVHVSNIDSFMEEFWDGVHEKALHSHHDVGGLTATFLTMKVWGDIEAMARVFQQNAQGIAADIRREKLGDFVGSYVTQYLLHCLFSTVRANLLGRGVTHLYMRAATDLLVTALQRYDRRGVIHENREMAHALLEKLQPFCNSSENTLEVHAVKCAVKYAALFAHAVSIDKKQTERRDLIVGSVAATTSVAGSAAGLITAPSGAGGLVGQTVQSVGGLAIKPLTNRLNRNIAEGALLRDAVEHFNNEVIAPARDGEIRHYEGKVMPDMPAMFARRAFGHLKSLVHAEGLDASLETPDLNG